MNARILSIAAFAAFASLGAQAADFNGMAGNVPANFEATVQGTNTRAEVAAEAAQAIAQSDFKNYVVDAPVAQSPVTRAAVRNEGAVALRSGHLVTGEQS